MRARVPLLAVVLAAAALAAVAAGVPGRARALEVQRVQVPEATTVDGHVLLLNGAGLRRTIAFDVYVGALCTSCATWARTSSSGR